MINDLEGQSKSELIKIIKIQQEETLKMQGEIDDLKVFVDRFKKAVFHFNRTHGDTNPLLNLAVSTPELGLEAHNLTQQAKGVRDCRESTGFWDVGNCAQRTYLRAFENQLLEQAKEIE